MGVESSGFENNQGQNQYRQKQSSDDRENERKEN
jgi:hypothetical protein